MQVKLIVAMDEHRGIGKNNDLMWHLATDMKFFKDTTQNQIVVMGRKNYDSIPEKYRPLPNRENAILTRQENFVAPNCTVFNSLEACLEHYKNETERTIFIIGGGQVYKEALDANVLTEMFITYVEARYDAETFFPEFDETEWKSEVLFSHPKDEKNEHAFVVKRFFK